MKGTGKWLPKIDLTNYVPRCSGVKVAFLLMCLVNNIRRIVQEVLVSAITLEESQMSKNYGQGGSQKQWEARSVKGIFVAEGVGFA